MYIVRAVCDIYIHLCNHKPSLINELIEALRANAINMFTKNHNKQRLSSCHFCVDTGSVILHVREE